jgi:hypothetical protein
VLDFVDPVGAGRRLFFAGLGRQGAMVERLRGNTERDTGLVTGA